MLSKGIHEVRIVLWSERLVEEVIQRFIPKTRLLSGYKWESDKQIIEMS